MLLGCAVLFGKKTALRSSTLENIALISRLFVVADTRRGMILQGGWGSRFQAETAGRDASEAEGPCLGDEGPSCIGGEAIWVCTGASGAVATAHRRGGVPKHNSGSWPCKPVHCPLQ